jgi:subtilisin family serine protease
MQDLAATGRRVDTFVLDNSLTFPPDFMEGIRGLRPNAAVLDEDVKKGSHGTKMAIIAAGKDIGVAPNANLYLVKAKGSYLNDGWMTFGYIQHIKLGLYVLHSTTSAP